MVALIDSSEVDGELFDMELEWALVLVPPKIEAQLAGKEARHCALAGARASHEEQHARGHAQELEGFLCYYLGNDKVCLG